MAKHDDQLRLRKDKHLDGRPLTQQDRERLVKPYLPAPQPDRPTTRDPILHAFSQTRRSPSSDSSAGWRRPHLRPAIAHLLHLLLFHIIQSAFSIYIYGRRAFHAIIAQCLHILYYHHRSPELIQRDVQGLSRLPNHLSIIVDTPSQVSDGSTRVDWEDLERVVKDVCEIVAWSACAGLPMLSIYEKNGLLKQHIPHLSEAIQVHLRTYFASNAVPLVNIRLAHQPSLQASGKSDSAQKTPGKLDLVLLSSTDGRDILVDLTKTLAEMSQKGRLSPSDISTDLVDGQVTEASFSEPDLLVVMASSPKTGLPTLRKRSSGKTATTTYGAGGEVCLRGYPPWQVRLSEIFYDQDSNGVQYQVFLKALCKYAKAQMRFGR